MKVFLGGTCNESKWRNQLMPLLKCNYFNPVVVNWTAEDQIIEEREKESSHVCLYVITPKMKGVYSIAELVKDACTGKEVMFVIIRSDGDLDFDESQMKSLYAVSGLVKDVSPDSSTLVIDNYSLLDIVAHKLNLMAER